MKLFVQTTVFNKDLVGKAFYLDGYCVDGHRYNGVYLVRAVDGPYITFIDYSGRDYTLHLEDLDFENEHAIKITLLTPNKEK